MDVFKELGIVLVVVEMAPTGRLTPGGQEKYRHFIGTCKKAMTEETNSPNQSQSKSEPSSRCDSLVSGFSGFSFFAISENGSENGAGSRSSSRRNSFSVIDLNAEEDPNGSLSESDEDDEEENLEALLMPAGPGNSNSSDG